MIEIDQQTAVAAVVVCAIVFAFLTYFIVGVFAYREGVSTAERCAAIADQKHREGCGCWCVGKAIRDELKIGRTYSYTAPDASYRTEHLETALRNLIDAVLDIHGHSEDMEAAIDAAEDLLSKTD